MMDIPKPANPVTTLLPFILPFFLLMWRLPYHSPVEATFCVYIFIVFYAFLKSLWIKNHSVADEMWSIMPVYYAYIFAATSGSARSKIMFSLVAAWAIRMSYNFYRKGGYKGLEDHRWGKLRETIRNPILWQLFNFFFICVTQNALLLFICLPGYFAPNDSLNLIDIVATLLNLGFLLLESIADNQQWNFQKEKQRLISEKKELTKEFKNGFLSRGLFRYSRHPNFFGEIGIWWSFYLFTQSFNLSIIGPISLTLLFQGSSNFTEKISASKYPEYKVYQKITSKIIPWFPQKWQE
ncbi:unnamed protein product [Blepharisma stoltei]|uniref:Steroid 5-alpha reductase C-terminal domain-containing protein n=1 Tax=Blepharisma stoltei TaxID=1481888 RepID=A0AAU9IWU3_9CILI|nr:unnamed protein product [Blepharisma stoltei]